jgi:arylsulfatase A-like enzyme
MKNRAITLAAAFIFFVPTLAMAAPSADLPNIVLIMADDLGYSELGSYGQTKIRTPNLDRLARQGMRFTRNYAGNAVCAPSRYVLMTGKHPGHAYIRSNREVQPEGQAAIPKAEITIAEVLKQQGYVTGAFGKWGLGPPGSEGDPLQQGFDRFFGYNCQRHAHSYYPAYLWSDDRRIPLDNRPPVPGHAPFPKGADPTDPRSYDRFKGQDYAPDRINAEALRFIRENKERRFFLYYPTVIPHVALHVPDEDLKPYLIQKWVDPPFTKPDGYGYTPHYTPRAAYAAMISRMDRYVGRLLSLLDELQLADNTLVIFTSDNGTTHLKGEVDYDFFRSVEPLRGLKGSLYEGGIRVPLIVRWPGKIARGSQSDYVTGFEDWLPTLAAVTGQTLTDRSTDGINLLPVLQGEAENERPFLYREFPSYGGQQAVWLGKWKGIRTNMLRKTNRHPLAIQLFDLSSDASEQHDLSKDQPELVKKIARLMADQHIPSDDFPIAPID